MAIATFKVQLDDNSYCNLLFLFVLGLKKGLVREVSVRDPCMGHCAYVCGSSVAFHSVHYPLWVFFQADSMWEGVSPRGSYKYGAPWVSPFLSPWFGNMKRSELLKCLGYFAINSQFEKNTQILQVETVEACQGSYPTQEPAHPLLQLLALV